MIPLYTDFEYSKAKADDFLPLKCEHCGKTFSCRKKYITREIKYNLNTCRFCSKECCYKGKITRIATKCSYCGKDVNITPFEKSKSKSGNVFCSQSCAAKYNNTHKTKGTRVSKLEKYIQAQLLEKYPQLSFLFNDKTTINSELDIYIPSLKLAFELNGIFHYEPIFGGDKLNQIKKNDNNKFQLCSQNNISLCIIDTSSQQYFKEHTSKKFLSIITEIIDKNLQQLAE